MDDSTVEFFSTERGCDESEFRDLENGVIKRHLRGAVVTFECDERHVLEGSATVVCDGQKWNDTKPTCLSKSEPILTSLHFLHNLRIGTIS
jgi:hypothetical protein